MTVRARVLILVLALAVVAGTVIAVGWFHQRALEERIRVAAADAVVATDFDPLLDRLLRARTAGMESLDAIRRTGTTTTLLIDAARRKHAREVAARRAAARRAAARHVRQVRTAHRQRQSGGLLIGDSVSLGAESCLTPLGYTLDSEVGRQFAVGLERLRAHATDGLPGTVIVHLGTNGPFSADDFAAVMALTGSDRRVVWVTIALPDRSQYGFADSLNGMIRSLAAQYPNVRVADWAAAVAQHPDWMYDDGIHINSAGCTGFTGVVDAAVRAP